MIQKRDEVHQIFSLLFDKFFFLLYLHEFMHAYESQTARLSLERAKKKHNMDSMDFLFILSFFSFYSYNLAVINWKKIGCCWVMSNLIWLRFNLTWGRVEGRRGRRKWRAIAVGVCQAIGGSVGRWWAVVGAAWTHAAALSSIVVVCRGNFTLDKLIHTHINHHVHFNSPSVHCVVLPSAWTLTANWPV